MLVVPDNLLRILPATGSLEGSTAIATCRVPGCAAGRVRGQLGFCAVCALRYEAARSLRGGMAETLCTKLAALGDPHYAVFGACRKDFGEHVLAHLEELSAIDLHVPVAAIEDLVAELDARARQAG